MIKMESTTFLYHVFGENIFIVILAIEFYMVLLHIAALTETIPYGRPYRESFVRMNLVFETFAIHTCFWHFWYPQKKLLVSIHYCIHLITNFGNCFIDLADFSVRFKGWGRVVALTFVAWDTPHHIYTLYYLLTTLTWTQILLGFGLFSAIVIPFPQKLMYVK